MSRNNQQKNAQTRPIVSEVLTDGRIVELVYKPDEKQTMLCIAKDGEWLYQSAISVAGREYRPYSPENNLLKNNIVRFPSEATEYGTEEALLSEVQGFIHRHVALAPIFEKIASYYILFSWVFDAFSELPYLRARGDFGTGKTRFLLTIGSLCYKPIFASGASSVSPLFRMLEAFRGTLIIDESDFRWSDERAEMVKILNNGNARGFPVLRSETDGGHEYNPRAFPVFGPKILATRGDFTDQALESRFLTEDMGQIPLRSDIPINLSLKFEEEACSIRNKLLCFRLRNRFNKPLQNDLIDDKVEPRLRQVFTPLLSIVEDLRVRRDILELIERYDREMKLDRGLRTEAHVLEAIKELSAAGQTDLTVKAITECFVKRFSSEYKRPVTTRWIGYVLRKKLGLATQKSHGNYVLVRGQGRRLCMLMDRFGVALEANRSGTLGSLMD